MLVETQGCGEVLGVGVRALLELLHSAMHLSAYALAQAYVELQTTELAVAAHAS